MRMFVLIRRIFKQVIRDKRTMALLLIAPVLIITLLNYIFPDPDDSVTIAVVNVDNNIVEVLKENDVIIKEENSIDTADYLKAGNANAVLEEKEEEFTLTILNDNPMEEGSAIQESSQAVTETKLNQFSDDIDGLLSNVNEMTENINRVLETLPEAYREDININTEMNIPDTFDTEEFSADQNPVSVNYIYGDENHTFFEILNPVLISFFVFFFVFLIAGMSMLKERSSGTLEKLLSTPIKRSEIVLGYLFGYGIFAVIQTAVIISYSVYILDMEIAGSIISMFIINIFLSFVALGLLLSTFVNSEFQMMQFIPLVIVPQIFFSGMLKVESMENWLQWFAPFMPLYYAGNAMIDVVLKGYTLSDILIPLSFLAGFIILFTLLNIIGMKRYRKV
ncbi:ABC transporter permease [Corticicoccus populi]|uniref:ABC transporter permease n=1 Tax=Corticicoccus populi TaxID=1812821 RepID=A0ABW5WRY8_9STAP